MPPAPFLTKADALVLENLLQDVSSPQVVTARKREKGTTATTDETTIKKLDSLNDETSDNFETTVFSSWDPEHYSKLPKPLNDYLLQPYIRWAQGVVRKPTDVIFVTHILIYLFTVVPSAIYLYCNFTWLHGVAHWLMVSYYAGPFTLLLHNHIHGNGLLSNGWAWLDQTFPYVLEPMMGHTWDSYWAHHCKMHHVEGNGPDDLSSTIRYQRDELTEFLRYWARFFFLIWIELPLYFYRTGKTQLAISSFFKEQAAYALIYGMAYWQWRPTLFVLALPFVIMRIALMVGNYAQHAIGCSSEFQNNEHIY
jgi:phosphoinositide-3-kinase regulatory subunit 4